MLVLQILRRNTHIFFTNAKLSILSGISWLWMAKTFYPFVLNAPFIYPLKTSENLMVFWCFQGVDMGALRRNGSRNIFHYFSKCVSNSRSFSTIILKVTPIIEHKNTAEENILTHKVYSLLLKFEKNEVQYSNFHFHCCSPWHADFASDLCSIHISTRGYTNMMAVT